MAFFDDLAKKVSKGFDQASFEAEKLVRVNKIKADLGQLEKELFEAKAELGDRVMELHAAGTLTASELEDWIKAVTVLVGRIELQEKNLASVQAETYDQKAKAQAAGDAPAAVPPSPPEGGAGKFCPECGASVSGDAAFCPGCGAKVS